VAALLQSHSSTHQDRAEHDAAHAMYSEKLARLNAAENGLCFGRLDRHDNDEPPYIGRCAVHHRPGVQDPVRVA
jgi:DNA helicase IV